MKKTTLMTVAVAIFLLLNLVVTPVLAQARFPDGFKTFPTPNSAGKARFGFELSDDGKHDAVWISTRGGANNVAYWTRHAIGTITFAFIPTPYHSRAQIRNLERVAVKEGPEADEFYFFGARDAIYVVDGLDENGLIKIDLPANFTPKYSWTALKESGNALAIVAYEGADKKHYAIIHRSSDARSVILPVPDLIFEVADDRIFFGETERTEVIFDFADFDKELAKQAKHPVIKSTAATNKGVERLRAVKRETESLLNKLKSDIFGQDYALEQIAQQLGEAKINSTGKAKVMVAMGPTGAGKTYTASKLADLLHRGNMMEINGSEYSAHKGSLDYQKLWGGSEIGETGALIEAFKKHPDGLTLVINEGEKMHPDIWRMFMEVFDTGSVTDGKNNKIAVENLVVIITSNRGAKRMFPPNSSHDLSQAEIDKRARALTQEHLSGYFEAKDGMEDSFQLPPEIIKRIDQFVVFGPVSKEAALLIAKNMAKKLNEFYRTEYTIAVDFADDAIRHMALTAWSISADARTIGRAVRAIMSHIVNQGVDDLALNDNQTIKVTLETDNGKDAYIASANRKTISVPAAVNPFESELLDPEFRNRLKNMKALMGEIVFGQSETINEIADAIMGHYASGETERPFSAFLLGVSGNGKTETGRALAKVIYGSEKRSAIIPLGNVSNTHDFDMIFGAAGSLQSGDVERIFEKTLREHPEGAVIVLDEASNMGESRATKTALFQKLYDLLEQGRYISPIDGREFNLSKYKFIFTGNDGQELFRGITSDDLLLETWRKNKNPEQVRELMRDAGIPAAFTNRINVISMTKPLLRREVAEVTKKLWDRQLKKFQKVKPGLEIVPDANLMDQLAKSFFTPDKGGRAVRDVLESKISALLEYVYINSGADYRNPDKYKMVISLSDSATTKAYIPFSKDRKVVFTAEIYEKTAKGNSSSQGFSIYRQEMDVTNIAPEKILLNQEQAKLTAFHEAGHAIANIESVTGQGISFITIRGGSDGNIKYYGYARYDNLPGYEGRNMTREILVAQIARLYAGSLAQQMAGFKDDAGWSHDLSQIRRLISHYLTHYGLERDLISLPVNEEGKPLVQGAKAELFEKRMHELIDEGRKIADERVRSQWKLIRAVTAELLLRGEIKRDRFLEIKTRINGNAFEKADARPRTRKALRCAAGAGAAL